MAHDTNDITSVPQALIFAGNINVAPHVSRLDAWLVAGQSIGSTAGNINTCAPIPLNYFRLDNSNRVIDSNMCNSTLSINGPIVARHISMNRTAGALPGRGTQQPNFFNNYLSFGSIDPAERFNLRPDTFLWAHSQMQRFSQAVTTFSRELPPRD